MALTHPHTTISWREPDKLPLRGTLIVLPGRGETPHVYERFGRRLAADSYRVHAVTAPSDDADRTREQVLGLLAEADPSTPRVLVGSDAGAAYAAYLTALPADTANLANGTVAGLVLAGLPANARTTTGGDSAPGWNDELDLRTACGTHRTKISEAGVRPGDLFGDLPAEWLDPGVPQRITVPLLGIHGANDEVSPVDAARRWYAGAPRAELVTITEGRHDALNDQTHRTVAATVVLFLERLRLGGELAPIATAEQQYSTTAPPVGHDV
ncbi:lysophospholipase [Micromonospora zingiberis]|uniref:Lysophospholipase n=2 Tax=Micromonospora zingiberis TaxID=2053011 RepID=A0A4R0GMY5_9ACTN|nr:lysophospholipase [Micromonospora zingiberis]